MNTRVGITGERTGTADDFQQVAAELGIGPEGDVWRDSWGRSAGVSIDELGVLDPAELDKRAEAACIGVVGRAQLRLHLPALQQSPGLCRLLTHMHYELFVREDHKRVNAWSWPLVPVQVGPVAQLFYVYVLLSGWPMVQREWSRRQIPQEVIRATLADFELWGQLNLAKSGRWHLPHGAWLSLHLRGLLYQLGRLQFEMTTMTLPFRVYQHRVDGRTVALVEPGQLMRGDGQFAASCWGPDAQGGWESMLSEDGQRIVGNAASADGGVLREPVTLEQAQWQLVLRPSDPVLSVHIPASGPLDPQQCRDSFERARAFFPRYYPEFACRGLICISWLMDTQLTHYLPGQANIVQFMRMFQPLAWPGSHSKQHFERVFGSSSIDVATAPQTTQLQRALVAHLQAGGVWRCSGGYALW